MGSNSGESQTPAAGDADTPVDVSFVVPARNEAGYLSETLASLGALETAYEYEVIVVDGDSSDRTPAIAREYDTRVLEGDGSSIAHGRNYGARHASGDWLAFIDADTRVRPTYVTDLVGYAEATGLAAASSYCRITGPMRAKLMEATLNHILSRLEKPILPGFNFLIKRRVFDEIGGFPTVANEDTAFSRTVASAYPTGYYPDVLVESSGRRIATQGLTGTLYHYARLDRKRLQAGA
ncbi:glycosyltransferase [Natronolimnobius baerhuensis]|uniref:Glycosyl transferase family 2 n=1 Tax=Natronolimnobius baerhuensis TaxID=253108 RepID=A0A202EAY9_9EURY|nr:glycosyltransferase [Natronolimnobius baerhuensis]OVE85401.1 glycosyl transferase family 2 [Natronolimnobius baerhuensis]